MDIVLKTSDTKQEKTHFTSSVIEHVEDTLEFLLRSYGNVLYVKIHDNSIASFILFSEPRIQNLTVNHKNFSVDRFLVEPYKPIDPSLVEWARVFFQMLLDSRKVNDCEFFLNLFRETPMATKNRSVADGYIEHLLDFNANINQHTILSFNTSERYKDIPIPNYEDFERCFSNEFGIENLKSMKWNDKESEFLFRGSPVSEPIQTESGSYITRRMQIISQIKTLSSANVGLVPQSFESLTPGYGPQVVIENSDGPEKEFEYPSKYKYIFALNSICLPSELTTLLFTGSCIILEESNWKCWFSDMLEPFVHYVPLNVDNVKETVNWCVDNESECEKIGLNARYFAVNNLNKNKVFDYMQNVLNTKVNSVTYHEQRVRIQMQEQLIAIDKHSLSLPFEGYVDYKYINRNFDSSIWAWNKALSALPDISEYSNAMLYKKDDIPFGVNNAFVGLSVINNLCKEIPNFLYVYGGFFKNSDTYQVNVQKVHNGFTLDRLIKRGDDITDIMIQIILSLQIAYERFCFSHGNLDPSKIIIQPLDKTKKLVYRLADKTWAIDVNRVAIISDYSNSVCLSNFDASNYKPKRMFIGDPRTNNLNDILHVKGDADVKYLIKKIGKKVQTKLGGSSTTVEQQQEESVSDPVSLMSSIVKHSDIKRNNIRFGMVNDACTELPDAGNARLVYDKITGVKNADSVVVDRVLNNPLPKEDTAVGNAILQYEIIQTLKSSLMNYNVKFSVDVLTTDRLNKCIDFVKSQYDILMVANGESGEIYASGDDDLWGLKMYLRKYLGHFMKTKVAAIITANLKKLAAVTIKHAIKLGAENTKEFYRAYKTDAEL
jgi:hypothetical protein